MTRTYKVKGEDSFGVELERSGDLVRLRTHTPGWPFPAERTLPRDVLVWMCGDPEPNTAAEPTHEAATHEESTNA
jgi:hypothetical protein